MLRIYLGCPERGGRDMARMLEWEYWNGERWKPTHGVLPFSAVLKHHADF